VTYASTFAFVLVLAAVVCVAVVLIISLRRTQALESQHATMLSSLRSCIASVVDLRKNVSALKSTAPTTLAAEVAALREAVDKLADTQRRFAGRFDARMGKPREPVVIDGEIADDDELKAFLDLQSAPPRGP